MKTLVFSVLFATSTTAFAQNGEIRIVSDSTQSITRQTQQLREVAVTGTVPKTKMRDDAMVTRVVGSAIANAGSAEDALTRIPGLVNINGKLSVVGKGTPRYYINGRKVHDLSELQRLSSHDIKEVEVISNPGARYDAQTNAVVRIITLRRQGEGLGLTFETQDRYGMAYGDNRLSSDLNMSYRINALEMFGGINYSDKYLNRYQTNVRQESFGKNNYVQDGSTRLGRRDRDIRFNVGADWQLSDKHSMGISIERNVNLLNTSDNLMVEDVKRNNEVIDHLNAPTHTDADGVNTWLGNAYYYGKAGKLSIEGNVDIYHTDYTKTATTHEEAQTEPRTVNAETSASNHLTATKWIATYPLGMGKITAGTEMTFVRRNNTYNIDETSIRNDRSHVCEDTYAIFTEYTTIIPMAGMLTMGLRYEHVNLGYDNYLDDSHDLNRRYDNLFPSISFGTQIGGTQAMLSYTVKTQRPHYSALRSNIEYNNRFTLSTGDPRLKHETSHEVTLGVRHSWLAAQVNYTRKDNGIYDWTSPYGDEGTTMITWVNLDKPIRSLGAFINVSPTIKRWSPNYTIGIQKQWLTFDLNDPREPAGKRKVEYNKPMFIFNANNTLTFPTHGMSEHGPWQVELNSEFLSGFHWGNAEIRNCYWNLTIALQKSWFRQDALTLRLAFGDLFRTAYHNVRLDLGNYILDQSHIFGQERSEYAPHHIRLTLRYKFNTTKTKYRGTGAGKDVKERMKI